MNQDNFGGENFYEPIPLIIFVPQSLSLLRTENEKIRFQAHFTKRSKDF